MRDNPIRLKLAQDKPTLSTRVMIPDPAVIEAIGHANNMDYVEFLAEYTAFNLPDLDNLCRTTELYGLGSMIKLEPGLVPFMSQRAIGSGFNGILFCDSRSAEDVRNCVRLGRPDHPDHDGLYGAIMRRNCFMQAAGSVEYIDSLANIVLGFMIEKKEAVDNLDAILAEPGVDMIQWGPSDYSMSIGKQRRADDPELIAVEKHVFTTALNMGIPARAEIETADQVRKYLDMGVRHFSVGIDLRVLHKYYANEGEQVLKALEGL